MPAQKTPTAIKKLRGGDPRNFNTGAPHPTGAPTMPKNILGEHGRKFWREHSDKLVSLGILTQADGGAFLALCQAYELMVVAWLKAREEGVFRQDENNVTRRHPAIQVWRDAQAAFLRSCQAFGLTPVARESLRITTPELDDYESYVSKRG